MGRTACRELRGERRCRQASNERRGTTRTTGERRREKRAKRVGNRMREYHGNRLSLFSPSSSSPSLLRPCIAEGETHVCASVCVCVYRRLLLQAKAEEELLSPLLSHGNVTQARKMQVEGQLLHLLFLPPSAPSSNSVIACSLYAVSAACVAHRLHEACCVCVRLSLTFTSLYARSLRCSIRECAVPSSSSILASDPVSGDYAIPLSHLFSRTYTTCMPSISCLCREQEEKKESRHPSLWPQSSC